MWRKELSIAETIIRGQPYNLDKHKYKITNQDTNRGDKYGLPHTCSWEKSEDKENDWIEIGQPLIRLTEISEVEYKYGMDKGTRKIFKSWLFHNEECLVQWLDKYNPEDVL